jgi:signal recognition particle GTPase
MMGSAGAGNAVVPEKEMKRVVAIIDSMTPKERRDHTILNGNRKKRVAKGSGTSVPEINRSIFGCSPYDEIVSWWARGHGEEEKTREADPGHSCSVRFTTAHRFLYVHFITRGECQWQFIYV